jgi:iron complex outermembrane recepter protein
VNRRHLVSCVGLAGIVVAIVAKPVRADIVKIIAVAIQPTASGTEIVLKTTSNESLQVFTSSFGKTFVANVVNTQLQISDRNNLRQINPVKGIASVTVSETGANSLRIVVTGETELPKVRVQQSESSLVLSATTSATTATQPPAVETPRTEETPKTPAQLPQPETTPNTAEPETPAEGEELEVVVSATRTEEQIEDVPRSVTVINRKQIEKQTANSRDLGEILSKLVPGLTPPRQQYYAPTLRGRNPLVLIDGVPVSSNFTTGFGRDLRTIDPGAIERIEVVRGPSAIYGEGASGGVINFITRTPQEEFTSTTEIGTNFSTTNPANSFGYNFQQGISGTEGNVDYILNLGLTTSGDWFDAEGDRIPIFDYGVSNSTTINALGKVGIDLTDEQRLQFTFNRFNDTQSYRAIPDPATLDIPGTQKARALNVGELDFLDTPGPGNFSTVANLQYSHQNLFGSQVNLQAYYRDTLGRGAFFDLRPFDPEDPFPLARSVQDSERVGSRLQIETPIFKTASLLWGADYSNEDISETYDDFDVGEFDRSGRRVLQKIGDRTVSPEFNVESLGLFAQLQWDLSEQFIFNGGLRQQWFEVSVPSYVNERGDAIEGGDRNVDGTVFNSGLVFKATEELSLFANFAQGFSIPDIARILRRPPENFNFGRDVEISEPIKVDAYEIGIRGAWQNVQAFLAAFYTESDLGGTVVFDDPTESGRLVRSPRRDYGVEAAIDWQLSKNWQLGGSFTYVEAEDDIDDDGEYQAITSFDISPVKFTAYVEHQTTPGWTNRLQLLAVGDRDRAFDDGVDEIPVDGYLVVDYISSIQVGSGTLEIGIENLFNNQYSTITSQYVGSFDDSANFAARGRTLSFGYRVTW